MFGGNLLQRNSLQPWWERLHNHIVKVYVAIIIGYGLTATTPKLSCLPVEGKLLVDMNSAQFAFINLYCVNSYYDFSAALRFVLAIFPLGFVLYADSLLENKQIQESVKTFSNARKKN